MHYLLSYELADDYLERRELYRGKHLALAWEYADRGELLLAGAAGEPIDSAMLLFKADSPAPAEAFAKADPYVLNGIVKRWTVRKWHTVVGETASNPLR
ncbi:YciI-like protein [Massilia endophytica]|uniref:YciI-like protein n=1 Tax=Massilia endophytica TaxID=2899220 RepID=UPI001E2C505B|nr:YciI-like protein [Massilia endophytica]UGQ47945.1 YciI family protein [Massilia endophytica]